ncbi:Protein EXORDIUM-like 2 [Vitis vinifera]|uniref:Protein EXORDIUM-like 2 n=1 Tax=Vitis vinifera TaxID=29760 RepID=A0A438FZZ5_VITVI|nr:Protein EXORDIUM-like 2 [Vitis vinifera]
MTSTYHFSIFVSLLLLSFLLNPTSATPRKLFSLVQEQPLILKYHNGPLLKGNITLNLVWYGNFSPIQRSILVDFLQSLNSHTTTPHSVSSWWQTIQKYKGVSCTLAVGNQILDEDYSLGKSLRSSDIISLASRSNQRSEITVVFTSADVAVEGFCMSRCGTHGSTQSKWAYAWWTPPLVSPNGDVGIDGMLINLATVLAGTVTNPFDNGYFQGSASAPLEAVTACTGIFGTGAYPGYPGEVLADGTTGASYNAVGVDGRKYLLPAMWDPQTSTCKTLV